MLSVRNLLRSKTRSIITLIGIAIGISAFVAFTSISNSLESQVTSFFYDYRVDIIIQAKGASSLKDSIIHPIEIKKLSRIDGIKDISFMIISSALIGSADIPGIISAIVVGASSIESVVSKVGITDGRVPTPGKHEIILGEQLAQELNCFPESKVFVNQKTYNVAGITTRGSEIFDSAMLLDISGARKILKIDEYVNLALVRAIDTDNIIKIIGKIKKEFPTLSAYRLNEFIGQNRFINTIKDYTKMVTALTIIISSIVVMNTLILAVFERKKEIGILMALGWSRFMVMKTIVTESVILCFLGGVLGNILGFISLWMFHRNTKLLGSLWLKIPVSISPDILFESIGLSVFLGLVSSIYPAILASRHFPINALHSE